MMIKSILTLTLLSLFLTTTFAEKTQFFQFYKIISDTVDITVPDGKCLITGTIYRDQTTINEAEIISEKGKLANSNKLGKFKILVDTSNKHLTIRKNSYDNAYVENYKFKNKHKIIMDIFLPMPIEEEEIMVFKPIIYAYNKTPFHFSLKFDTKSENIFTYPKYEDNWTMTTTQNGMLKSNNNKEYPYLFWEGNLNDLTFKDDNNALKGNPVKKENVVNFLEKSLLNLGLNAIEQTDFITFWAPRMIQHDEVYVQFLIDEDYDVISTMEITPKPDNLRRIYLIFTAIENIPTNIELQQQNFDFAPLDRSGFTIIEWGGSEINTIELSNN